MKHYKSAKFLSIRIPFSGVTDGGKGNELPPWQAKYKNWAPLADILVFGTLLSLIRLLFFLDVFVFLAGVDIHDIRIHYHFLTLFWELARGPPTVASVSHSATFCTLWLKPLVTPLHRCRRRQILGSAKDFCPNFPNLAGKNFGPFFVHEDHISDDLKKCVILGSVFSNKSKLGAIF